MLRSWAVRPVVLEPKLEKVGLMDTARCPLVMSKLFHKLKSSGKSLNPPPCFKLNE